jgi:hypothetical protein
MRRPVRRPLSLLSGHLGSSVSALIDGQLDEESTERAWQHVMSCPPCRRLVEHEGWVKRQLAQIAGGPPADEPSDQFLGSLLDLDPAASESWAETERMEASSRTRRRAGIALVGAGSVSAAVFGLSTLGGAPLGFGGSSGTPATSIGGASATPTPTRAVVAPASVVHGRLRGWTLGSDDAEDGVAHARAAGTRP